jgi:hypothetical protein
MEGRISLKLRMIADAIMVLGFGAVAPAALSLIGRNWRILLMEFATFLVAAGFCYDFFRTRQRFRKLRTD